MVETDASVIFARSIGQVYNEIHVQEQIIAGNIILDIASVLLPFPKGLNGAETVSTTDNSIPILRYFTNNAGYEGILKSGILEGKTGVYASISKSGKISKFKHLLLLGIRDASKNIIIPQKLYNQFRTMYPIGPISALNFLERTKYLPPGKINLLTVKNIPNSEKIFIPWQYPADILIDAYIIWFNWYCDDEEN